MKLDRTTYEAWLLDRIEGKLTPAQERELDDFLAANPDLEADTAGLPAIDASATEAIDWKNELKKDLPPTGMPDAARLNEFLVARSEGELTADQLVALDKFLYEHPEFGQAAKRIAASKVDAPRIPFQDKGTIERHFPPHGMPDKHRLMDFLIAAQEGELGQEQQRALNALLRDHPEARKEQRLVAAAKVPAERVVFSGKEGLKKRETRVIALWQRYAVAASIALLLGFAWWMTRTDDTEGPAIARNEAQKPAVTPPRPDAQEQAPQAPEQDGPDTNGKQEERHEDGPKAQDRKSQAPANPVDSGHNSVPLDTPDKEPLHDPRSVPAEGPAPAPQRVEAPVVPEEQPDPMLAQDPAPTPQQAAPIMEVPAFAARDERGGTPLVTALANSVRHGVLETDTRDAGLDGGDALAMANKAIGAVTGGKGRVDVAAKDGRSRWKLRLGQHLAISASTGR